MDVDPGGTRGDCGSGNGVNHDCTKAGGGGATSDDFAACDSGVYVAEYREFVYEVAEVVDADVGVLSNVFVAIWGVGASGICDYCKCARWIWVDIRDGGADFPAVFLLEADADEWDVPGRYQCEDTDFGGAAGGWGTSVVGFAQDVFKAKAFGGGEFGDAV